MVSSRVVSAVPPFWETLVHTDPNAGPAQRPELWKAFAATVPGMSLQIILVERSGTPIGAAPLMLERRAGYRWIHALPYLLSGAPLALPDEHEVVDRAVGEALRTLQGETGAAGGEWTLYRPLGPELDASVAIPSGETRMAESSIMVLGDGIEEAWLRVDRTLRYELRRARLRQLELREEPDALAEVYGLHLEQSRGWPGHRPLPIELTRRLLEPRVTKAFDPDGPVARLFTIRSGSRLLCGTVFLDSRHETFAWWSGGRNEGRAHRAQAYLYWSAAQWACLADRARLNLGGSTGLPALKKFKRSLGALHHEHPVRWFDARLASVRVRCVASAQAWWRRGRFRGEAS